MSKAAYDKTHQIFQVRHGLTAPRCRGIKRQGDPARVPQDQFWTLQNVRVVGNQLRSRGGQTKVNSSAETGCIVGIFDAGE